VETVFCPRCNKRYEVSDDLVGRQLRCSNAACRHVFTLAVSAAQSPVGAYSNPPAARPPPPRPAISTGSAGSPSSSPANMPPVPDAYAQNSAPDNPYAYLGPIVPSSDGAAESHASVAAKRPLGLVWIVFYFAISGALTVFLALAAMFATGFAAGLADTAFSHPHERDVAVFVMVLLQLLALAVLHLGILLIVACYGLWTFRRWGLTLANTLLVIEIVLHVLALVLGGVSKVLGPSEIVMNFASLGVCVAILTYLSGSPYLKQNCT